MPKQTNKKELEKEEKKNTVPKKKSTKPKAVTTKKTSQPKEIKEPETKKTGRPPKKKGETNPEVKNNTPKTTPKKTNSVERKEQKEMEKPVPKTKKKVHANKTQQEPKIVEETEKKKEKAKNEKSEKKKETATYQVQRKNEKGKKHAPVPIEKETENTIEENVIVEMADELLVEQEEIKVVKEERKAKNRLTSEQKEYMKKQTIHNTVAAIMTTAYFVLLTLAFKQMKPDVFLLDLQVFSGIFLVTTIILVEHAYKKDSGKWAIHGIEMLVVAIITLLLTHVYTIATENFTTITLLLTGVSIIYYSIKCVIILIQQIRKSKLQDVKTLLVEKNEKVNE